MLNRYFESQKLRKNITKNCYIINVEYTNNIFNRKKAEIKITNAIFVKLCIISNVIAIGRTYLS